MAAAPRALQALTGRLRSHGCLLELASVSRREPPELPDGGKGHHTPGKQEP